VRRSLASKPHNQTNQMSQSLLVYAAIDAENPDDGQVNVGRFGVFFGGLSKVTGTLR